MPSHALCITSIVELSDYFDYVKHDVFFTIVMLILACRNHDSYSSFKDPQEITLTFDVFKNYISRGQGQGLYDKTHLLRCDNVRSR